MPPYLNATSHLLRESLAHNYSKVANRKEHLDGIENLYVLHGSGIGEEVTAMVADAEQMGGRGTGAVLPSVPSRCAAGGARPGE